MQVVAYFCTCSTVYKQSGKSFWFNLIFSLCLFIDDISCYWHKHIIPGKKKQAYLLANGHRGPLQQEYFTVDLCIALVLERGMSWAFKKDYFLNVFNVTKEYFCLMRGVQLFAGMCVLPAVNRARLREQIHGISTGAALLTAEWHQKMSLVQCTSSGSPALLWNFSVMYLGTSCTNLYQPHCQPFPGQLLLVPEPHKVKLDGCIGQQAS